MGREGGVLLALSGDVVMAAVAFQAIGSYIGGPIGGMIGSVIGGYVDQALFGPGDQEGPRISDLSITTSTYGAGMPLIFGPENRVAGNVIWSTDLIEHKEEQGGKGGPSYTEYSYSVSCAVALSGRSSKNLKRVWANNKLIYDADAVLNYSPNHELPAVDPSYGQVVTRYYVDETVSPGLTVERGTHSVMDEIRFYPGNAIQEPDSFMESHEGVGNVPGYRHITYVVFKDLQLADFGNRIPNFEFELEADSEINVSAVVSEIMAKARIENSSVIGLTDNVRGYAIGRQAPVYSAILPLETAFNFRTTEQRGQIRFIKRSRGMKGTVPLSHMGARVAGSGKPTSPITYRSISEVVMPDQVSIIHRDPSIDYQANTQTAFREAGNAINKVIQEIPVTLEADQARRIADRLLWGARSNKKASGFNLTDRWIRLNPGDMIGVPVFDEVLPFEITRATRGNNGLTDYDLAYEDPEIYNSQAIGTVATITAQSVSLPGVTTFIPMDCPLLKDENNEAGFYWAATGQSDGWRGATIKRSSDDGITYADMSNIALRTPIGDVSGTLGSGPSEVFDTSTVLTVTLTSSKSSLESISDTLVFNGNNAAWVGPATGGTGEIIQFRTATLVATNTYELTGLLRGRLGTEHAITTHGSGEVFVLLQAGSLGSSEYGINDWDKLRYFKAVSLLSDETITEASAFTNTGVRAKPLSPTHPKGARDVSNNLTVTWLRRSRFRAPGLGGGVLPLGEVTEAYEIDIYDGATVVRTIEVTAETASYSAAEQTTDGLTPGNPVTMDIYQISESRGRGYAKRAIL